jgi:hypothetical protein
VSSSGNEVASFLNYLYQTYFVPNIGVLVTLLIVVWAALSWNGRRRTGDMKKALRFELKLNIEVARSIQDFVDTQKTGDPYVTPIPRFYSTAYDQLRDAGEVNSLKIGARDQVVTIYRAIKRVDEASDRQEELLVGTAATSPLAGDLRAQNLQFIRDTISNTILPGLEHATTF